MSTRRVPVNAAALLAGRVASGAVSVVVASVSAHRLDQHEFGLVVSTLAAGFLANTVVTFGTDTVVTRAVAARDPTASAVTRASLLVQLGVACVIVLVAAVAVRVGAPGVVLLQALVLLPMAVVTVTGAVLRGAQMMDKLLVATLAGPAATLVTLFATFAVAATPFAPVVAVGAGSVITAAVSGWLCRPLMHSAGGDGSLQRSSPAAIAPLLRESSPFAAMVLLAAVGAQVGPLLVEFATDDGTGGYGVAVRLSEAARLVPAAVMGAAFPAMLSGLHRTERYRRWVRWLLAYASVATIGLWVLAGPLNRFVFDDQAGGAPLIRILAIGLVFTVWRLALSFELLAERRDSAVLTSSLIGAVVTVIGGLVVAARYGAPGIAWSQLAGLIAATVALGVLAQSPRNGLRRDRVRGLRRGNGSVGTATPTSSQIGFHSMPRSMSSHTQWRPTTQSRNSR